MGKNVWSTLSIIVGADPLQVSRATGRLQYAALRVSRKGGSLSYTPGFFETATRLPDATEPRLLGDVFGFAPYAHVGPGALGQYAKLYQAAVANEQEQKSVAARLSVEDFKEQGRRQTRNPVPQRNSRKAG